MQTLAPFRFKTFQINESFDSETDPNLWTVERHEDYIVICDEHGAMIDEVETPKFSALDDLSLICYAIGWLHAKVQEREVE